MRTHSLFRKFVDSQRRWLGSYALRVCALSIVSCAALSACDAKRELTEWKPTDHQPPPTVTPEGQGQGASDDSAGPSNTARAAATLFETRCASCHGVSGRGDGPGKPPGATLPDMTRPAYRTAKSDEELHAIIKNGRGLMPPFADQLTDLGIDALVGHVRTLSGAP